MGKTSVAPAATGALAGNAIGTADHGRPGSEGSGGSVGRIAVGAAVAGDGVGVAGV
jgi:hypothetical protein